jgi:L-asparaginase
MGHILLLDAGGTISARPDHDGALAASAAEGRLSRLLAAAPVAVQVRQIHTGLSEAMSLADIAAVVAAVIDAQADPAVDGVVVAHGTDVMEETAFLADLTIVGGKPVIFTGAQRAAGDGKTDGQRNLRDAINAAASPALVGAGVTIAFAGHLVPARQAAKMHTSDLRAFRARDGREGRIVGRTATPTRSGVRAQPLPWVTPSAAVETIALGAGSGGVLIAAAADLGFKGLVVSALGRGNAGPVVLDAVKAAIAAGVVVVVASRCPGGRTAPDYVTGRALHQAGAIFAGDLGVSQARILLATLLATHGSGQAAGDAFRAWIGAA